MFVDASAIIAITAPEADGSVLAVRLTRAGLPRTSALAVYEATLGLARMQGIPVDAARSAVDEFRSIFQVEIIPVTEEIGRLAIETFARYGHGNHPARLNMGDCFAYACARSLGVPLLFKGSDFAQTDIDIA
jgi:ribonuclease VapC